MYLSSDFECAGMPNSGQLGDSSAIAANNTATNAAFDQMFERANGDWLGLLSRPWQSYAAFGPHIAFQLRNGQPIINQASLLSGTIVSEDSGAGPGTTAASSVLSSPAAPAVSLVAAANPDGSNPAAGGSGGNPAAGGAGLGPRSSGAVRGSGRGSRGATSDDSQWVQTFGTNPDEYQGYNGPLPTPGSAMSLVMGGRNRPLLVGPGRYPAATPNPQFAYSTICNSSGGVSMTPVGESANSTVTGTTAAGSSDGTILAVLGILALAGLGYWADHEGKRRGKAA